jgi:HSP20 family protein
MATNKPPVVPPPWINQSVAREDGTAARSLSSPLETFRYSRREHQGVRELDVFEHDGAFTICADLPALNLEEASIQVTDNYVKVEGERRPPAALRAMGAPVVAHLYGRFSRTVRLPVNANAAAVTWTFEKGVLQITIPLLEQATWTPAA